MRPATPTTATSSPPPRRKSGSIRWAPSRSPARAASNLYFKGLLDKLGVTANVYRVGTYKSAVEPFIRNDMSPEARENYQAFGEALLESWREGVLRARPQAKVDAYMQRHAGRGRCGRRRPGQGRAGRRAGRQDRAIAARSKLAWPSSAARMTRRPAATSASSSTATSRTGSRRRRADRSAWSPSPGRSSTARRPRAPPAATASPRRSKTGCTKGGLKALVVRVDSPGGSVLASERIRQAILAAKDKGLPVVVSMGNVAASGGYWVATPADFIFAEPSTITGSIGVFGVLPSFQGTLAKLGMGADGIKTTPLSGEPDLLRGPSPEASRLIQASVESIYRHLPRDGRPVAPQVARRHRPDRPGAGLGRRHRPPARPGRRLRRHGGSDRQGGRTRQARQGRPRRSLSRAAAELQGKPARDAGHARIATTAPRPRTGSQRSAASRSSSLRR